MDAFDILRALLSALLRDRQRLVLENLALRQQLTVLRRGVTRPKLEDKDRIFWIGLLRLLDSWREALHIVQPETVVRWHRQGFRHLCLPETPTACSRNNLRRRTRSARRPSGRTATMTRWTPSTSSGRC